MAEGAKTPKGVEKVMMETELLNINQAAELLGISPGTLYHWVSERRVPHIKLGLRCLRFRRGDLAAWIATKARCNDNKRSNAT